MNGVRIGENAAIICGEFVNNCKNLYTTVSNAAKVALGVETFERMKEKIPW